MKTRRNEKIAEIISGIAFFGGMVLEYLAVATLESGALSSRVYWALSLIGAGFMYGSLLFARIYGEYLWRKAQNEEERNTK